MTSRLKWILLLALLLRLGAVFAVQHYLNNVAHREFLIPGDAEGYWELGQRIANGQSYEIYSPPRRVMRMPGVPLLLAVTIKVGGAHLWVARCAMALCGTAACGAVYWLGKLLVDERVACWAALLAAVSPSFIGFSTEVLSEIPFGLTLSLSLACLYQVARRQNESIDAEANSATLSARWRWAFVAGASVAIATYMRPTWLLVAPMFVVWSLRSLPSLVRNGRALRLRLIDGALVMLGCALLLLPWTIRNYPLADQHIVPTTLWVGPSLYDGLHPQATGDSNMQFFEDDQLLQRGHSEYQMDHEYRRRAWAYAREHPGRVIELAFIKLGRSLNPWPNAVQFRKLWLSWPIGGFTVLIMSLAVIEIWYSRNKLLLVMICLGPLVYFAAIHALFVGSVRYRLPAEYPLLVLSSAGLVRCLDLARMPLCYRRSGKP